MSTRSSARRTRSIRSDGGIERYVSGSSTFSYTVRSVMRLKAWKMKPMSRLRMRVRSAGVSVATGRPSSRYVPSVGESSRPRIERSVDLPQPEGPAIATYSPCLISMWMPERAWVSTSSVRKTLVTPSSLMRESGMGVWVGGLKKGRNGRQQKSALARGVLGDKRDHQREDEHQGEHGAWTHKH